MGPWRMHRSCCRAKSAAILRGYMGAMSQRKVTL